MTPPQTMQHSALISFAGDQKAVVFYPPIFPELLLFFRRFFLSLPVFSRQFLRRVFPSLYRRRNPWLDQPANLCRGGNRLTDLFHQTNLYTVKALAHDPASRNFPRYSRRCWSSLALVRRSLY